jgi:hypothetical protein
MNPTTAHSSEVLGQLVLIDVDPIRQRVKHAIAGFLAGYSGTRSRPTSSTCADESVGLTPPASTPSRSLHR